MKKIPVSFCIMTKNSAKKIEKCLKSIEAIADEIIIVDDFSEDNIKEIAENFNAKFYLNKFNDFVSQRNFSFSKAKNNWIFYIDSDEELDEELKESLLKIDYENKEFTGYKVNRKNFYLGKWLLHGNWYPYNKIRLFDKRYGKSKGISPHDYVAVSQGKLGKLNGHIKHYPFDDIFSHIQRENRFSSLLAKGYKDTGKKFKIGYIIFRPIYTFIKGYFIKKGFLDGIQGFIIAVIESFAVFLKYIKLYELERKDENIKL